MPPTSLRPSSSPRTRAVATGLGAGVLAAAMMAPMTSAEASGPGSTSAATTASGASGTSGASGASSRPIAYHQWSGTRALRAGTARGVVVRHGRLRLPDVERPRTRRLGGTVYQQGGWDSPWHSPGFALTELIPSWSARTPGDSLVEVRVRGREAGGRTSSWDLMARWASGDSHTRRTTSTGQADDLATVDVDTWRATNGGMSAYQVRVTLLRARGQRRSPSLDTVGAVASRLPAGTPAASRPGPVRGRVLDVPRYSQMVHRGHYPAWGNGGEAWCSPTATSMVLGYYDRLPAPRAWSWVPAGHLDPWVDLAARRTYDHGYRGTGNWPFNTAYAATRVGRTGGSFVTRLRDARQAERFIAAGIPLVASVSFGAGQLAGSPISATNGHLLVIVGFDRDGDVVVNDPAAPGASGVRRTYDRAQFERAWLTRSGGLVYVIHDRAHPLPGGDQPQW